MLTTTLSDFRKDMRKYLDSVTEDSETLIINRGKDSGVVVISMEEYNSLNSTQHELSSRKNEERLDSALEKLKKGSGFEKDLVE
ncbi:MAG: type II toxin-antitoxin system Phd/YefM family antitoxin [Bacteroidota bacterium]